MRNIFKVHSNQNSLKLEHFSPKLNQKHFSDECAGPSQALKIRGSFSTGWVGIMCPPPLVEIGLTDLPKTGGLKPRQPPRLRQPWCEMLIIYFMRSSERIKRRAGLSCVHVLILVAIRIQRLFIYGCGLFM